MMSQSNGLINLNKFKKQSFIGEGSFGKVYKVIEISTEKNFAAKMSKTEMKDEEESTVLNLKREINIISELNHPSVLKFIGYSPVNFKQKPKPVIITEYASNGSLDAIISLERQSCSPPSWDETKKLINIHGIASAMAYLHTHNIIHRDLKPANILEDDYLFPKIADFGLSKMYHQNTVSSMSNCLKGTPLYLAPECFKKDEYTKASDVFAYSIILYELLTLEEPYKNTSIHSLLYQVAIEGYRPEFKYPIPNCYRNLITKCWSENPDERPTFEEIITELKTNPEFITDGIDKEEYFDYINLIENSDISFDPSKKFKKITISEIQEKISEEDLLPANFELSNIKGFSQLSDEFQETFKKSLKNPNPKLIRSTTLHTSELSILYFHGSLDSSDFINILEYFEEINIELQYPSEKFESIFNIISDKWSILLKTIKINISISDMKSIGGFLKKKTIPFSITIESSVTEIGYYAFDGCSTLNEINIPTSVNSIGGGAFIDCSSIKRIVIPPSVNKIRKYTFTDCSSLKYIMIPTSIVEIERSSFNGCSSICEITIPSSVIKIGQNAFKGCSSLTEISIPSSVKEIGPNAFERCTKLTKITIPSSITEIGSNTFERCSSLTDISIPSSVTKIGSNAFERCSELIQISILSSVTKIEEYTFNRCSSLSRIVLPNSIKEIGNEAFSDCSSLIEIQIPSSVTKIGSSVFAGCSSLTKFAIPPSLDQIGVKTLRGCSSISFIEIRSNIDSIVESFCSGCSSLKYIEIPSSVSKIDPCAFRGCSSLSEVVIPKNVTAIGFYAFVGCSSLESIEFENGSNLKSIGNNAFNGCSALIKISIPSSVTEIGDGVFCGCSSIEKIFISSSAIQFGSSIFKDMPSLCDIYVDSHIFQDMNQKRNDYSIDDNCNIKIIEK